MSCTLPKGAKGAKSRPSMEPTEKEAQKGNANCQPFLDGKGGPWNSFPENLKAEGRAH